jgi:glycerophosphoryl diester phosphodiesterase
MDRFPSQWVDTRDRLDWEPMPPRLAPLLDHPIGFAHRGARAHAPENTIEAFELAVKLGATGMESDVWVTADGVPVLDHDGTVGGSLRKKPIGTVSRAALPEHIPTLEEYYDRIGTALPLSLDLKDPLAFTAAVAIARNAGAEDRLWICHPRHEQLTEWRHQTSARLVDSTRLKNLKHGPERRADLLRNAGIDAINMRLPDWSGGMIAIFHRFDRYAFGWDAQHPRQIAGLIDSGIDGIFSDHVDRLAESLNQFFPDS